MQGCGYGAYSAVTCTTRNVGNWPLNEITNMKEERKPNYPPQRIKTPQKKPSNPDKQPVCRRIVYVGNLCGSASMRVTQMAPARTVALYEVAETETCEAA